MSKSKNSHKYEEKINFFLYDISTINDSIYNTNDLPIHS